MSAATVMPLLAVLLTACACHSPALDTAGRVVRMDLSRRADGALLSCQSADYTWRLRAVKP